MALTIKDAAGEKVKDVEKKTVYSVDPDVLVIDWDENGRIGNPDLTKLKESIAQIGLMEPVIVRKDEASRLAVVAGYCRAEAVKEMKAEHPDTPLKIDVIVADITKEEALIWNLHENLVRNALSPMDAAKAVEKYMKTYKKTAKETAKKLGKTDTWVRQTAKFLLLDQKTQELLHSGELSWSAGVMLAGVEEDERKKIVSELKAENDKRIEEAKARQAEQARKNADAKADGKVNPNTETAEAPTKGKDGKTSTSTQESGESQPQGSPTVPQAQIPTRQIPTSRVAGKVTEAAERGKAQSSEKSAPKQAAIRQFFESLTGPGEVAPVRNVAEIVLSFLNGKTSDVTAAKKFRKALGSLND
jgi:ParB/RepB/Spo0J family partition protein